MIETNIRMLEYSSELYLKVRQLRVNASSQAHDIRERVCSRLARDLHIAAAPFPSQDRNSLIVTANVNKVEFEDFRGEDWFAKIEDIGSKRLYFREHDQVLANLFERQLLINLDRKTDLWTLESPRNWYAPEPIDTANGIDAYRRYRFSVISIAEEGLALVTHVSTAFFTHNTVAHYFAEGRDAASRRREFEKITRRQKGQKGTLLYDLNSKKRVCYFEQFLDGVTCEERENIPLNGKVYSNLFEYYSINQPQVDVRSDSPVAMVSFKGLPRPVPVAADLLRIRVFNNALPKALKNIDKITPAERRRLIYEYIPRSGLTLLGRKIHANCWQPKPGSTTTLNQPQLVFGGGVVLEPPEKKSKPVYKAHYKSRLLKLNDYGAFYVPPHIDRNLIVAAPDNLDTAITNEIAISLSDLLATWTRRKITPHTFVYSSLDDAIEQLNAEKPSIVFFIFDQDDASAYYLLSVELQKHRIKRATTYEITKQFSKKSFVEMNALELLQKFGCVPWMIASGLNYGLHLAIDVGGDFRHFAVSAQAFDFGGSTKPYWQNVRSFPKPNDRSEAIEQSILIEAIKKVLRPLRKQPITVDRQALVFRDGRNVKDEPVAIYEAIQGLGQEGILPQNVTPTIVDFAKSSLKQIRLWETIANHRLENVLEGTILQLDNQMSLLTPTGRATLTQGTAVPLLLSVKDKSIDIRSVVEDAFASAQLNWGNPRVAQRLPLCIKLADDELEERRNQEVRGLN